ncbi:putative glycosyltransferase isoform X1 [Canna indica]|uniref:Glycosyltransferase isoform X1 n=1 Tax=Canna indica TaxID=4628 RepID=A0AAQ3JXR4_9LILI|nr:putative glycosyltransferase isoform X1 [Canna indica]
MVQFQKPWRTTLRSVVLVIATIAFSVLVFQTSMIPSKVALSPPFHAVSSPGIESRSSSSSNFSMDNLNVQRVKDNMLDDDEDDNIDLGEEEPDSEFLLDLGNGIILKKVRDPEDGFISFQKVVDPKYSSPKIGDSASDFSASLDGVSERNQTFILDQIKEFPDESNSSVAVPTPVAAHIIEPVEKVLIKNTSNPISTAATNTPVSGEQETTIHLSPEKQSIETLTDDSVPIQGGSAAPRNSFGGKNNPKWRKNKRAMPPLSMLEMNKLLVRNRASYRSMRPRWSSAHDQNMLAARVQIENAPILKNDQELYAPAFRNLSTFKRSYELMESTLKVYIYKEGAKPVFHQPLLKGIYASEGWFMKLMERNKHFVVKDPRKANMFYIPFSSRFLEFALYDSNLHSKKNMVQYLQGYVDMIASKYPFWNRTGGADHFVAACHDWAPYETRHTMDTTIRALCNADIREGFRVGKDVSLPETLIRLPRNPVRELGGRPASERTVLAFFAGNMHGSLRPILLQHWENKDPDMKIFGPMRPGASKMSYSQYMKSSKYCICPRGYEVNSPRIVESIFYECVPVIISDNYVLPFFEVLNWEAFSVIIPEEDVPRLKEILVSIPMEKYLSLQQGVKKVQKHFLWHNSPVKYDIFHMILHSIWFNRVFTIRAR